MKTVFQRGLSLIMCLILICSTMSVMAFGASAEESFSYKTYAQNATKENVHYLMDFLDETLEEANGDNNSLRIEVKLLEDMNSVILGIVKGILNIFVNGDAIKVVDNKNLILLLDLSSVDAICKTLDNYRAVIELASNKTVNALLDLGDLKNVNLDVFDEGLSRAKGDVKVFSEILELANANSGIIEKLLEGSLDLGVIGEAAKLDLSGLNISKIVKEGIVDALFGSDPNRATIKAEAVKDFDKFVYNDVIGLLSKDGGILEGISVNESTTIDHLITDVFDILINKYLIGFVEGKTFRFADLDVDDTTNYAVLDTIIQIDGDYDFTGIEFTKETSVINQINNVLGKVFKQIVPNDNGEYVWETGDYTKIGNNMRNLVKYIAKSSGLIEDVDNKSDDALMLEIFKVIFQAADTKGEKEVYNAIKHTETLTEMVNNLVIYLSGKSYPAGTTYEHVLGDWIIEQIEDTVPLYDEKGKAITVGGGKTVWDVLNSVLNFFLVDKNLDAFFGWNFTKSSTYFDKLDIILDYTANDGTANFNSKTYINDLINSILTVNLQKFVNLTAVKALGNGRNEVPVVKFLYNTIYNLLNNWTVSKNLTRETSDYFQNTLENDSIAKIVKAVIETLNKRSEGTACLVGVVYGAIDDVIEKVESKNSTCTATGFKTTKTCLKCNKVYLKGATIAAKGHKYDSGRITKNPTCTAKGEKTYTCTVCRVTKKEPVAAKGHKASGYKVTKAATYKTKGQKINKCTVCKATLGTQTVNMLTLNKPAGLKATALSTTSIKFSWNKVTGAESYVLYYRTGSGKWKTVNTTKTSATVKKLNVGATYKFKVVAVAGSNKSKDSSTVSATTKPSAVTLKALRSKKKKEVVIEWKKVSGVTGYEIQYSTSKKFTKKTTKTVTIKKQSTVKTIIKKLKSKKTYYVKVRAYKTVNKVKVYGAYSKVKNIKCK